MTMKDDAANLPRIDVEMYYTPDDPSKIGFNLWTVPSSTLTPQMIIDAIADCLMEHLYYVPELDAEDNDKLQ